ncbi:MAG: hypothetical protein LBL49_07140 [Clostridiales Family XIII bacterium]|jgi:hypothetical protein|nr:hypothetical protein [Clostridiales Family XIII bacterium]
MGSSNAFEYGAVEKQRTVTSMTNNVKRILSGHGIAETEMEGVKISITGSCYTVSGVGDEKKRLAVEAELNTYSYEATLSWLNVHCYITGVRPQGYVLSGMLMRAESFLQGVGKSEVRLTELSIGDDGKIHGLTPALEEYFAGVEVGENINVWNGPKELVNDTIGRKEWQTKRNYKWFLESVVTEIQHRGYENLPKLTHVFEMKDGRLTFHY